MPCIGEDAYSTLQQACERPTPLCENCTFCQFSKLQSGSSKPVRILPIIFNYNWEIRRRAPSTLTFKRPRALDVVQYQKRGSFELRLSWRRRRRHDHNRHCRLCLRGYSGCWQAAACVSGLRANCEQQTANLNGKCRNKRNAIAICFLVQLVCAFVHCSVFTHAHTRFFHTQPHSRISTSACESLSISLFFSLSFWP